MQAICSKFMFTVLFSKLLLSHVHMVIVSMLLLLVLVSMNHKFAIHLLIYSIYLIKFLTVTTNVNFIDHK